MESQSWYTRSNAEERIRLDHMDEHDTPRFDNIRRSKCGETIITTLFSTLIRIPRYTRESSLLTSIARRRIPTERNTFLSGPQDVKCSRTYTISTCLWIYAIRARLPTATHSHTHSLHDRRQHGSKYIPRRMDQSRHK